MCGPGMSSYQGTVGMSDTGVALRIGSYKLEWVTQEWPQDE